MSGKRTFCNTKLCIQFGLLLYCFVNPSFGQNNSSRLTRQVPIPYRHPIEWRRPQGELNEHGLHVQHLPAGEERNLDYDGEMKNTDTPSNFKVTIVKADEIFEEMQKAPVVMDLIFNMNTLRSMSPQQVNVLNNGGIAVFRLFKISKAQLFGLVGSSSNYFYALQMIDERSATSNDIRAYWLPASRYETKSIDIPVVPGRNDPKYLFTPPFSGCSLTVDYQDYNGKLHVRHIFANHENEQYNNNRPVGQGMVGSMLERDYACMRTPQGNILIRTGFALLHFDNIRRPPHSKPHWMLRYQGIVNQPLITEINGGNAKGNLSPETRVSHVETKILDESDKREAPVPHLPVRNPSTVNARNVIRQGYRSRQRGNQ